MIVILHVHRLVQRYIECLRCDVRLVSVLSLGRDSTLYRRRGLQRFEGLFQTLADSVASSILDLVRGEDKLVNLV